MLHFDDGTNCLGFRVALYRTHPSLARVLMEERRAAEGTFVSLEGLGFRGWKVMGSRRT